MSDPGDRKQDLVSCFADFHAELDRAISIIGDGWPMTDIADGQTAKAGLPSELAGTLVEKLAGTLKSQAELFEASEESADYKLYRHAQYAMVALADEWLQGLDWGGERGWPPHLLEQRVFGSQAADSELFRKLDELLLLHNRSAQVVDLATVYLLILQLGFHGRHRDGEGAKTLVDYRTRLASFASSLTGGNPSSPMFAAAYTPPSLIHDDRRLPPRPNTLLIGGAVVLGYLLASNVVWLHAIGSFDRLFGGG